MNKMETKIRKLMTYHEMQHPKVYVGIYQTPLPQAGCKKREFFKQSTTGLNSVFLLLDWLSY